jgi:Ribbon-helix-helix domain
MSDTLVKIVRGGVPPEWHRRLDHLSVDLAIPRAKLIEQAVLLLLRHHGLGAGLPEPVPPTTVDPARAYDNAGPQE